MTATTNFTTRTGNNELDGLLMGIKYQLPDSGARTLTYSFPPYNSLAISDSGNLLKTAGSEYQDAVRYQLSNLSQYLNVAFTEVTGAGETGDLKFSESASSMSTDEILRFSRVRPIAALGRTLQSRHAVAVDLDNRQGAFDATDHLIGLGHRRIAFIAGPTDHRDAEERLGGYRDALKAANLPFDRALVAQGDFHESGGLLAMNRLLDSAPDFSAVFAANDQTAYGARLALYRRGIRLPDDMSLVGFDDLPSSRVRDAS